MKKISGKCRTNFCWINAALRIFKNEWQREALNEVINSSHKLITNEIKIRATELIEKES
jgi:hypothetical protein